MNDSITKVKQIEIEILREFVKVCNALNLRWYAGYGTALGAIRHKGFIPWDDDVDVVMPRKDYEIFCKDAQKLFADNYFVQTLDSDKEYWQPFAKVRRSDTTFWEEGTLNDEINHGIYMDIFPLDGYPTNWFYEKIYMIKRVVYDNFLYQGGDWKKMSGYRKIFALLYRIIKGTLTKKEAAIKKEKLVTFIPYDDGKLVSCLVADTPKAEAVTSNVYGNAREVVFEDMLVRVPDQCEVYLEKLYGDYMQFPPEEERIPLHTCVVIDTEKSYLEYHNAKQ